MKLVLVPGLVCDETVWRAQLAALAGLASMLVADSAEQDSIEAMASAVLEAVPGQLIVAGHSLGGRIALEMVRQAAARIEGLALLNSGYRRVAAGEAGEREIAARERLLDIARREGMRAMGQAWLPGMLHPQRRADSALVNPLLDMIERCPLTRYEAQVRALIHRPDASEVLTRLSCPTLVLGADEDAWSPRAQQEEMARMAPHSVFVSVPDCGHMSTVERPERVNAALKAWLLSI